ncbi:response regulator transcription factor [Actinoplanes utahensis]|uniref:response regulator transcription factor n=1 Tax=Actinoplanes utahensis TaxID=1869 RepID=UPI0006910A1B|nr:response regulator transcription factor [Actinoplanes utahensis]GIF33408.1 hypothetical protein Aut01nite_63940 [Actinoplanes utahensis]
MSAPAGFESLRYHAEQLIEIASELHEAPSDPVRDAEQLVSRLVRQSHRRSLTVRASYGAVPVPEGLMPLRQLSTGLSLAGAKAAVLFTRDAMVGEESAQWGLRLAARGADVRVAGSSLPTMAIMDNQVALVAVADGTQLASVFEPVAIQALQALHTAIWDSAVALSEVREADMSWTEAPMTRRVLGMLNSGRIDEVAARELNLSVRTYRRHVAELMARVDARSRFHAGVRVARLGLDQE